METMKSPLIAELEAALERGEIESNEVSAILEQLSPRTGISYLHFALAIFGGIVAFSGLAILMAQNWSQFGSMLRVFLSLGSGVVALGAGIGLASQDSTRPFAVVMFILSLLLIPTGVLVSANELGLTLSLETTQMGLSLLTTSFLLPAAILYRSNTLALGSTWSLTWFFLALTQWALPDVSMISTYESYQYRSLVIGLTYVLLSFGLESSEYLPLRKVLNFLGSGIILITGYSLMRSSPNQNILWEILYPGLSAAIVFFGVENRIRSFVANGAIALNFYIVKISFEYFANSIGWPLAMIFAGFAVIATTVVSVVLFRDNRDDPIYS